MIKKGIIYIISHLALCLAIFLFIQKPIFLLYNWQHGGSQCTFSDLTKNLLPRIAARFSNSRIFNHHSISYHLDISGIS